MMAVYTVNVTFGLTVEAESEEQALAEADRLLRSEDAPNPLEGTDFELSAWKE